LAEYFGLGKDGENDIRPVVPFESPHITTWQCPRDGTKGVARQLQGQHQDSHSNSNITVDKYYPLHMVWSGPLLDMGLRLMAMGE